MLLKNLKTKYLGRSFKYYKQIDSTQSEIWRLYESGNIQNGTLIISEIQTKGKGTHGRTWYTNQKNNIAFSFLIKPNCNIEELEGLTIRIAQIIVEILKEKYQVITKIKEPNDIILNEKKLCGILTETKVIGKHVKAVVIGIGLNTNQMNFAEEIKNIATSVKKETGKTIDTLDFITEFCNRFEQRECEKWEK